MSPSSPEATTLIFCGGEPGSSDVDYHHQSGDPNDKKPNVYVQLFDEMLRTLVETEPHLFNLEEIDHVSKYAALSQRAKFLLTKLLLRKFNTWHRLDSLKFEAEIGSTEDIIHAINEICAVPGRAKEDAGGKMEVEETEIIDLTLDDDVCTSHSHSSHILPALTWESPAPQVHTLAPPVLSPNKREGIPMSLDTTSTSKPIAGPSSIKIKDAPMRGAKPVDIIDLTLDDDIRTSHSVPSHILPPLACKIPEIPPPQVHSMAPRALFPIKIEDVSMPLDPTSTANPIAGPSSIKLEDVPMHDANPVYTLPETVDNLAEDESQMNLPTLLECLRVDELRSIVKQMRVKAGPKKPDMIDALLRISCTQSTLGFACATTNFKTKSTPKKSTTSRATSSASISRKTTLPFGLQTAQNRLRDIALRMLGKCVRVHEAFHRFVRRANIIYFRLTQSSQQLLLPALLSRFKKRSYTSVAFTRTKDIWSTRAELIAYEKALEQEELADAVFSGDFAAIGAKREFFKTPGTVTPNAWPGVPETPMSTKTVQTPSSTVFATPASNCKSKPQSRTDRKEAAASVKTEKLDSVRVRAARIVKDIFEEAYPRWQDLVKAKSEQGLEVQERGYGLERFESGYILTRLICKGAHSLGILGEHEYELKVLESLLAQRRWRRGRRGRWYERRALILEKYAARDDGMKWAEKALVACVEALEDDDTHIVFRSKLERRLTALERKLDLDPADRHTIEGKLLRPVSVSFEGVRACHRAASLKLDRTGRNTNDTLAPAKLPGSVARVGDITKFLSPIKPGAISVDATTPVSVKIEKILERKEGKGKGKSIWIGRDNLESTVETLALQWYEDQGFKGIHSETRIIATLFGILFWDIIFLPIPGAFETPYQTAPLDIAEDAFYHGRRDVIEARLKELEDGMGEDLVKRVEAEHRARKTWCVGVDWDLVEEGGVVEIVRCLGGKALSVICRILCEDYAGRRSGGPDLFVWNADTGECKFVEVKGPGDSLQENQKVWIDVLLRAQATVEVCLVREQGKGDDETNTNTSTSTKTGGKKGGKPKGSAKNKNKNKNQRRGIAKNVESDTEEEEEDVEVVMQLACESEEQDQDQDQADDDDDADADALPIFAPSPSSTMDGDMSMRSRSCTYSDSTPNPTPSPSPPDAHPCSSKKRKCIAQVAIPTPSPRKKIKTSSRRNCSPEV